MVRADEQVTGAERIYLAQLAHLLDLDPATVQALEKDTGERIDALGDQGQPAVAESGSDWRGSALAV